MCPKLPVSVALLSNLLQLLYYFAGTLGQCWLNGSRCVGAYLGTCDLWEDVSMLSVEDTCSPYLRGYDGRKTSANDERHGGMLYKWSEELHILSVCMSIGPELTRTDGRRAMQVWSGLEVVAEDVEAPQSQPRPSLGIYGLLVLDCTELPVYLRSLGKPKDVISTDIESATAFQKLPTISASMQTPVNDDSTRSGRTQSKSNPRCRSDAADHRPSFDDSR